MRKCDDCRYRNEPEYNKPCVVYRADCPLYEKEGDGMNREEAIEELKAIKSAYSNNLFGDAKLMKSEQDALDMAIKALEQDPNCPYYVIDEDGHGLCMDHSEQKYCQGCKHNGEWDNEICLECEYDGHTRGMTRYELQEPSGDLISRQAVLDLFQDNVSTLHNYARVWEAVEEMPSVTQNCVGNALGALDCISRQAVIKAIYDNKDRLNIAQAIRELPFVNPQEPKYCDRNICVSNEYNGIGCDECEVTKSQEPKTGHWYSDCRDDYFICNQCKAEFERFSQGGYELIDDYNYCPNCGCRMVEPQESEG